MTVKRAARPDLLVPSFDPPGDAVVPGQTATCSITVTHQGMAPITGHEFQSWLSDTNLPPVHTPLPGPDPRQLAGSLAPGAPVEQLLGDIIAHITPCNF